MYTAEEVDKKILEFRRNTKDQGLLLHNNYFIFTVDRDGKVCQEAYGANLMTDYGIRNLYVNENNFTGYNNWNFYVKFGTGYDPTNDKIPKLTNSTLYEFACKDNGCVYSEETLESGYYNNETTMGTDDGVFYQTTRFQYAQLDYIINLTAQTSVDSGHVGGTSSASPRDTRWKTDGDGNDYFEINEIGLTDHDNLNGTNLYFHFAILDKDGNPTPIRKYDNQKLYIYIYHTGIVSEKMILDAWDRNEYITIEPINRTYSRYGGSRALYCYLRSVEWDTVQWAAGENPIYYRSSYDHASNRIDYVSRPTMSFDVDTHTVTETFAVPSRLIERNDIYLSGFLLTNGGYNRDTAYNNYGSQWLNVATYDRQDTPETIIAENFYTNGYNTLRFDDQVGSGHHNNGRKIKLLPIDKINSVQSIKMFNVQDNDYTIDEEFQSMNNYFNQRYLNIRSTIYNIKCPDNEKRNVWYYPNIFASAYGGHTAGFASNMNIAKFTNVGITLFTCDNPFDISTWTQIEDITNPQLSLVKKRYFVSYNDVTLTFEFQESQYPAIIPKHQKTLIDDGTNFRTSSFDVYIKPMYNNKHDILYLGDKLSYIDPTTHQHIKSYTLYSPYYNNYNYKYNSEYTGYPFSLYHTTGTYDDWFWFKTNENGIHLLHIPSFTNDEIELTLFAKTEDSSSIHVSTNDSNIISIENPSAPYGFYTIDLNKTPAQLGIVNNDSYDPADIVATSYNVNQYKRWYTQSFITRPAADKSISPIIVWNNGKKSMTFRVYEYNENDELLYTSDWTKYDYQFHNDETVKYKLDFIWNYNNKSTDGNGDSAEDYNTYNGVKVLRIVEHPIPKYGIEGARHITCIRGTNKICFTYASTDYLTKWYVVDATDLYDSNNNLKILNTFEVDESFAKAYKGSIGFAHYVYIRLTNSSNVNGTYLFDLDTDEKTYLVDWDYDWELSTGEQRTQFYGDNRCIVFGYNCLDDQFCGIYGDYNTGYKKIYCISVDQPKTILDVTSKIYGDNDDYNRSANGNIVLRGFIVGYVNDGKQLILSTYGYEPQYMYGGMRGHIFTIDLGEFINKRGHTDCAPVHRYYIDANRGTSGYFFFTIPAKDGIIRYENGYCYDNATTKLWFCPIESFVPHKIELTTDCITSYNQPIQFSNKEFQIKTTNDMTQFKLENSGKHPRRT